jgi:hypothetical protein
MRSADNVAEVGISGNWKGQTTSTPAFCATDEDTTAARLNVASAPTRTNVHTSPSQSTRHLAICKCMGT